MKVTQVYNLVNDITKEMIGESAVLKEDLSNVVDVGTAIIDTGNIDNYVNKLTDRIAKTVFVNRKYYGTMPSVYMDAWEYGAVVEKVACEMPTASETDDWKLENGKEYSPNVFYQPTVTAKFFNNKVTFEIDLSFTDRQVKESFNSPTELNAFMSMLVNSVDKSMTVKTEGLIQRVVNNMIGETLLAKKPLTSVNLIECYTQDTGKEIKTSTALTNPDFIRYATMKIKTTADRMRTLSTLFNIGGTAKFTPPEMLNTIVLTDFMNASETYVVSETTTPDILKLTGADTVPYWQGSGEDYSFDSVSKINVKTSTGKTIEQSGIVAVLFDHDAVGVTNLDNRVTSHYNPKGEFYNSFYKMDMGSFNDTNENFVVFYMENMPTK